MMNLGREIIKWIREQILGQKQCPVCGHWMDNMSELSFEYYCSNCQKWRILDVGNN